MKKFSVLALIMAFVMLITCACAIYEPEWDDPSSDPISESQSESPDIVIDENGEYSDKDNVALYIHTFGHLPQNYIRKSDAMDDGWSAGKNLWKTSPGKSIGGDRFYNNEELLPDKSDRVWTECDIDYSGGKRNGKRIVFSNDGLIYYTDDHYDSFTKLY